MFSDKKDIHGVRLRTGDIVAEGKVGETIWNGKAIVMRRPLGIVEVFSEEREIPLKDKDNKFRENLIPIRTGTVLYKDLEGEQFGNLHLSSHDGQFYAWDKVEKIGSVDSLAD